MNLISWFEIPTLDLERAVSFYSRVFNCKLEIHQHEPISFAVFPHVDGEVSGCLIYDTTGNFMPSPDGVLIYFNMEGRIEEALKIVDSSGGMGIEHKKQIGPWGYRALISDSEANRLALYSTS